ncbi:UNVERIFIED_CONTAM: hypothetical protein Sangu_2089200 [Sesamum angustifolium]|uniref:Uncharacterized protein n=1 Tax=Sesamum angustifolium TaxID=2727405 RepID=A0AAW2LLT5_9LAMI
MFLLRSLLCDRHRVETCRRRIHQAEILADGVVGSPVLDSMKLPLPEPRAPDYHALENILSEIRETPTLQVIGVDDSKSAADSA